MVSKAEPELHFLPLGGSNEIGMNLNLFAYGDQWLMVDLGITFGDDTTPSLDIIMPDIRFIEGKRDKLLGLVLTHGHEDHIGAVPYLWSRLKCPVYATPFTASLVRRKLADANLLDKVELHEVPLSGDMEIGPFKIDLVRLTHSIPEPNGLAITTPAGVIYHTGDWKFDPEPVIGAPPDYARLSNLGDNGVLALIGDSTNVFVNGETASESNLYADLSAIFKEHTGRVAMTSFASNVARLETITRAALAADRHVGLVGRSMWRIEAAARENGYLSDLPPFVREDEIALLPARHTAIICTGSQGESRAALSRIADGSHQHVSLGPGDTVVFSSRKIPGNERAIQRLQNRLIAGGIDIITDDDRFVHVSGHPSRGDLTRMYGLVRPQVAIPVHGEQMHLIAHAALAKECQVPEAIVPNNGSLIRLYPGPAEIIDQVPSGYLALDGGRLKALNAESIRDRNKLLYNGSVSATVVLNAKGDLLADPTVALRGIDDGEAGVEASEDLIDLVIDTVETMSKSARQRDQSIRQQVEQAVRREIRQVYDKRPLVDIHLVRV
ncbi:ribonuclease J [Alphaproteobacteria bacterium]|jgi:ribonuclease J|nr:ribonuclease J [Alphaproteobacteria bacterium]